MTDIVYINSIVYFRDGMYFVTIHESNDFESTCQMFDIHSIESMIKEYDTLVIIIRIPDCKLFLIISVLDQAECKIVQLNNYVTNESNIFTDIDKCINTINTILLAGRG